MRHRENIQTQTNVNAQTVGGRAFDSSAPAVGQALVWDGSKWTPLNLSSSFASLAHTHSAADITGGFTGGQIVDGTVASADLASDSASLAKVSGGSVSISGGNVVTTGGATIAGPLTVNGATVNMPVHAAAPASPATGGMCFDSALGRMRYWTGTAWVTL